MAETPEERLARLRRELESEMAPSERAPSEPLAGPSAAPRPAGPAEPVAPLADAPRSMPATDGTPVTPRPVWVPVTPMPVDDGVPASQAASADEDEWSLTDAIGGAGLGQWVAIGLVVLGGYLLASQAFPGITLVGSVLLAATGMVLLWLHFTHRTRSWGLYAGALLLSVGALRVVGELLPFTVNGETSLGIGLAFLAIGYLRYSQAGGYGWQGALGVAALALGGLQLILGLLPGAPGVLDLVVPLAVIAGGILLFVRTTARRRS